MTVLRGVVLVAGCVGAGCAAWLLAGPPAALLTGPVLSEGPGAVDTVPFAAALSGICALLLLGCIGWLLLTTALTVTAYVARELAPGSGRTEALSRLVEGACPALVGRLVAGALGVAVTAGVAAPALADTVFVPGGGPQVGAGAVPGGPGPPPREGPGWLTGLALPDLPDASPQAGRPAGRPTAVARHQPTATVDGSRPRGQHPVAGVVVRRGDSLWSIASALLPASAGDVETTRAWHRLHHANLSRIGTDPDLILPGTYLVVPDLAPDPRAPSPREEAP
jgi:hypothetical protein